MLIKWLGLGIILFSIIFGASASANQHQKQEIQALIQQARDAWVDRDADAVAQLFMPDGVFITPGQRWQGQAKIRKEVTRFAQQHSDVKIDIQRVIIEGNQAAIEWHYEDIETATGRRKRADDVIIVDFEDGQISCWREYFDPEPPVRL